MFPFLNEMPPFLVGSTIIAMKEIDQVLMYRLRKDVLEGYLEMVFKDQCFNVDELGEYYQLLIPRKLAKSERWHIESLRTPVPDDD